MPLPAHRTVVITGGSSGIGLCTARLFGKRGWKVGLIARGAAALDEAAAHLRDGGIEVAIAVADVADTAALDTAAATLETALGPIGVWINDAGSSIYARFVDVTPDEFRRVIDTTLMGAVNGTRVALARIPAGSHGVIMQVGSLIAFRGAPLQSAYSTSKYALRGFNEAVRTELAESGSDIHLGIVHPPSVNTPFFSHAPSRGISGVPRPVPPTYQPEIVAEGLWLAVMDRRRELLVSGTTKQIALFNTLLPNLADRIVGKVGFLTQHSSSAEAAAAHAPSLFEGSGTPARERGTWTSESRGTSVGLWADRNRWVYGIGLALAGLAVLPMLRRR